MIIKRELDSKDKNAVTKKNDNASGEIKIKVNGVIEEIANCGNVDTSTVLETIDIQLEELSEGKLTGIKS